MQARGNSKRRLRRRDSVGRPWRPGLALSGQQLRRL